MVVRSQKALLWLALLIADSSAFVPAVSRRSHLALVRQERRKRANACKKTSGQGCGAGHRPAPAPPPVAAPPPVTFDAAIAPEAPAPAASRRRRQSRRRRSHLLMDRPPSTHPAPPPAAFDAPAAPPRPPSTHQRRRRRLRPPAPAMTASSDARRGALRRGPQIADCGRAGEARRSSSARRPTSSCLAVGPRARPHLKCGPNHRTTVPGGYLTS